MAKLPKYFYFRVTPVTNKGALTQVMVEDASDVDVVEVVRCIDCINWDGNRCISLLALVVSNPNAYCSLGERRKTTNG